MTKPATPARAYHHLNLREDLVTAGCTFVEDNGHEDLSVRMLAKQVGVSAGAPYHHFPDRRSLLIAIALEGYRRLTTHASVVVNAQSTAEMRLFVLCRDFFDFAANNPRLFTLMYESELTRPAIDPQLLMAQRHGYNLIREAVIEYRGGDAQEDIGVTIATLWSVVYGFALMRSRAMIQPDNEISDPASDILINEVTWRAVKIARD